MSTVTTFESNNRLYFMSVYFLLVFFLLYLQNRAQAGLERTNEQYCSKFYIPEFLLIKK